MKNGLQQDIHYIAMSPTDIFAIFNDFAKPSVEFMDLEDVILFKVDSLSAMLKIETKLIQSLRLSYMESAIGSEFHFDLNEKKLISNKRKPLFLKVSIVNESLRFSVYQENAKGIKIQTNVSLDYYIDIGTLSPILLMMINNYQKEKENRELKKYFKDVESRLFLLNKEDLERFSFPVTGPRYLNSLEKNQVLYTYNYYKLQYDDYSERIDDGAQRKKAEEKNAQIKTILNLCKECFKKFKFGQESENPE